MFAWIASPEAWIALATLTALEIVLGIDNIIFISILVGRLPAQKRSFARNLGLMLAMVTRLALLFSIVWVANLTQPWFTLFGQDISGRDIILIGGGLFLLAGIFRFGSVTSFIAKPVLRGFAFGLALTIILKQVASVVGVHLIDANLVRFAPQLLAQLPQWNWPAAGVAAVALVR